MPAPLAVDREAVKAHAITHGVREAARAFELPENTVKAWSRRNGWLEPARQMPAPLPKSIAPVAAPNAPTASEAARNTLERLGGKAKIAAAKCVAKGFQASARLDGETITAKAPELKALAGVGQAINLPGFEKTEGGATALLGLSVTVRPSQHQVVEVEAVVTRSTDQGQSQQGGDVRSDP